eukprot:11823026-Alexandrium_andersonii.AAC.1
MPSLLCPPRGAFFPSSDVRQTRRWPRKGVAAGPAGSRHPHGSLLFLTPLRLSMARTRDPL